MKRFLLALALLSLVGCRTAPTAVEMNRALGRGINLGNALEAPSEGAWGVTIQADDLRRIRERGFDSVRVPCAWWAHAAETPPYAIDPAFFARVDDVIRTAMSNGLAVVVNIHHYNAQADDPPAHEARLLALWRQIAEHYSAWPDRLVFELLNEPHAKLDAPAWNALVPKVVEVIRRSNPTRILIVGGANWSGWEAVESLELPAADRRIIASFHYYNPFPFTHQTAPWIQGSDAWRGTKWTGSPEERAEVTRHFDRVAAWAKANDRPIFLGEFGAFSAADMDSRARWTDCVARDAERHGFSWAYWEFCSGFGAFDPQANEWRAPLLGALIPR